MQKKVLIGLVAVVIIAVGAYALFHKSSNSTTSSSNPYGASSTPAATSTPAPAKSADIIQTKTGSSAGSYLADSSGNALYTYGADTTGKSNCAGSCLSAWPAYKVTSSSASLPANVTVITRDDGSMQYAYKGLPLYTFASDSSGQVTGDGVSNFHVAKP